MDIPKYISFLILTYLSWFYFDFAIFIKNRVVKGFVMVSCKKIGGFWNGYIFFLQIFDIITGIANYVNDRNHEQGPTGPKNGTCLC